MPQSEKKNKCLRVGITGGIGSGKTTVCRIFEVLGIPVYDADYWAKWLITNDLSLKAAIIDLFGPSAYAADGSYNRSFVADLVFKNPDQLANLNAAVHPAVEAHSQAWHVEQSAKNVSYTLKEAALLIESNGHKLLDYLIVVAAPEPLRIARVMQRDGIPESAVRARLKNQLPQENKIDLADFLIQNDEKHLLIPQVWAIHQQLLTFAAEDF